MQKNRKEDFVKLAIAEGAVRLKSTIELARPRTGGAIGARAVKDHGVVRGMHAQYAYILCMYSVHA